MPTFCSQESQRVGEPLAGTAPARFDRYLLLECSSNWPAKAWPSPAVPDDVIRHVDDAVTDGVRLQLVRRHRAVQGVRLMIADVRSGGLSHWALEGYEALLDLDLATLLDGAPGRDAGPQALWLTCTHSRRDRCCAKWGLPVQAAFDAVVGEAAWQVSHLGGHRFAANVLLMPHGIMLGRVTSADVPGLVSTVSAGGLPPLDLWRGRTSLAPPHQAAEVIARRRGVSGHVGAPEVVSDAVEGGVRAIGLRFGDGAEAVVGVQERDVTPFGKSCGEAPSALTAWTAAP